MVDHIDSFRGKYEFLSNFYAADVDVSFVWAPRLTFHMPTVEHAFQSLKTVHSWLTPKDRMLWLLEMVTEPTPAGAKKMGRNIELDVKAWDRDSYLFMGRLIQQKFTQHPDLGQKLLDTGNATLIERNTWGDKIWGMVDNEGKNQLGIILMTVRDQLRQSVDTAQ